MKKPRVYTTEEVQTQFLEHIWDCIHYWETETVSNPSLRGRLEGLAFSCLVALDGGTNLPAFKVVCTPHPTDREYHKEQGQNWFPAGRDIGPLHERFHRHDPRRRKRDGDPPL